MEKCLISCGNFTVKQLASFPIEHLGKNVQVCKQHIEDIINYLQKKQTMQKEDK